MKIYRTTMMIPDGKRDFEIDGVDMMRVLEEQYFPTDETLDALYEIVRHYLDQKNDFSIFLTMHSLYQKGRIDGIRQERARRKEGKKL